MRSITILVVLSGLALAPLPARQAVPAPKSVLGYELGERYTTHAKLERYLVALRDAGTGRMKLLPYGETYEGRTLYLAVFSTPENLARLEEIKSDIRRLADPRTVTTAEAERIAKNSPAIAWLSYGVHGNEASSMEAAMNVMYQLASRTDEEMMADLKNLVIVIDPLLNPDGHERFVQYETMRTGLHPVADRYALENSEDPPSGRTNHYYIDLNRDWAWLTQQETRARIAAYGDWKPQVHVDFHEMGYNSSYFFFPAFKPVNKNFPKNTLEWADIYGRANAAAFDSRGWSYWSGERFDLFYPGYGDSWPSFNGAIGMTYEQAGGGVGVRVKRTDETILTLKDRIEHHTVTSLSTLRVTAEQREHRLRDFHAFFAEAIAEGTSGPVRTYVIDASGDASRAAELAATLHRQGIEISRTTSPFSAGDFHTYFTSGTFSKTFPAGSYVISLGQPSKRLITALLEKEPALSDTFFYDISSWSLPVAYGVPTYWTDQRVTPPAIAVGMTMELPEGTVEGKATYAYLFRWSSNDAVRGLIWLLQRGTKANTAMKEFTSNGQAFPRGTIIVPVAGNDAGLHERVQELARTFHLAVYAANSGYTERGINLGSDRAVRIRQPRIIIAATGPVSSESYGAIWCMFDQQYGLEFVPMKVQQLRSADLHDYNVLIFPDDNGTGSGYRSALDSVAIQKINAWISGGGTFIGIEGGAAFASSSKIAGVKIKEKKKSDEKKPDQKDAKKEEPKKPTEEELEKRMTVEQRERKHRLDEIPGTMLRVNLDISHPLGFGYGGDITVFKTSPTMFELSEGGYNVGMYAKSPRLSGYISDENAKLIEETPFLVHEQRGSGNVILFTDDPNFRLYWNGLNTLFLNSILLMPGIRDVGMTAD
jgi:hypothetical protein